MRGPVAWFLATICVSLCLLVAPANAGSASLTLKTALPLLQAAAKKADAIGVPMVITVLDAGGNMIAQHRMDDALLASVEISANKAYTAIALKMPTSELAKLAQPGQPLFGIQNSSKIVIFGGGIPIVSNGKILGAIGVSGGAVEQDVECAKAGLAAFTQ